MNDLITKWLADLLDRFKAKNPKLFVLIQLGLVIAQTALTEIDAADVIANDGWIVAVLRYIGFALMILIGSRTSTFVKKETTHG